MPGPWLHLAARFFDVVSSRPLDADERARVDEWLRPGEHALFDRQSVADQRHALTAASFVVDRQRDRPDLIRAALLHDIGKHHAGLGPVGRVAASIAIRLGLPLTRRWKQYRDHGPLGAGDLSEHGAEPLVVAFVERHHGERPQTVEAADWEILQAADRARIPFVRRRRTYAGGSRRAGAQ